MLMDDVLRLHTDGDGNVWAGCNGYLAIDTQLQPEVFVREGMFQHASKVRVIGCRQNADLIVKAFAQQHGDYAIHQEVRIVSPAICLSQHRLNDPEFVLQRLWQPGLNAMTPWSWHPMENGDYTAYLLASTMQKEGDEPGDIFLRTFQYHPAWAACSFVPTSDMWEAGKLAVEIVDPRWYNHPERPQRSSKLMSYLGLNPANCNAVWDGPAVGIKQARARLVADAWFGNYQGHNIDEPSNFLWRIFRHHGENGKGLLLASKAFVQFVKLVWLQYLLPSRHIFDPEVFFKHEYEVEAFKSHLQHLAD